MTQGVLQDVYYTGISACGGNELHDGDTILYLGQRLSVVSAVTYYVANEALYRKSLLLKGGEQWEQP